MTRCYRTTESKTPCEKMTRDEIKNFLIYGGGNKDDEGDLSWVFGVVFNFLEKESAFDADRVIDTVWTRLEKLINTIRVCKNFQAKEE
jgi:hypothetical protein